VYTCSKQETLQSPLPPSVLQIRVDKNNCRTLCEKDIDSWLFFQNAWCIYEKDQAIGIVTEKTKWRSMTTEEAHRHLDLMGYPINQLVSVPRDDEREKEKEREKDEEREKEKEKEDVPLSQPGQAPAVRISTVEEVVSHPQVYSSIPSSKTMLTHSLSLSLSLSLCA